MNPALHTNCATLSTISPNVVNETLGMLKKSIIHMLCTEIIIIMQILLLKSLTSVEKTEKLPP